MNMRAADRLEQVASAFSVRDIMIPVERLVRASTTDEAMQRLIKYPDYDCIPMPAFGPVESYMLRDIGVIESVLRDDLISDGTSLSKLPDFLVHHTFRFVLAEDAIRGFVHFSDLNNQLVKIPMYTLFSALEYELPLHFPKDPPIDVLRLVLGPNRVTTLQDKWREAAAKRANLSWTDVLYFPEVLQIAHGLNVIQLVDEELDILRIVRNRVAHGTKLLVTQHSDTNLIVHARELARNLLSQLPASGNKDMSAGMA